MPTLHDGDCVIWDSLAICEYINEQYLDGKGYPNDAGQRALARSLACEMHSGFIAIRSQMSMDIRAEHGAYDSDNTELVKETQQIDAIWSSDWSEDRGDFLFGDFGIVDCFFAPVAFRFRTFDVPLSTKAKAYQQTLLALPEMQMWQAEALKETATIKA
ncbi:MAG: glutathione S-transferase [Gammaproteobacteria bacterium]|nr:MAG: glutathione S-transferase [Gammaproteobacteria bacterium]